MDDPWGQIYTDHFEGLRLPHAIVREDGYRNEVESAQQYFSVPRDLIEQQLLDALGGRVLDAACGPGSYALYLEGRGAEVLAVDASPGAIEVCHRRGCAAQVMDLRAIEFPLATFDAVILMGNTLGVAETMEAQVGMMRVLHHITTPQGVMLATTRDPLATDNPAHLAYHARNRSAGRPPGMVTLRLEYRGQAGPWWTLWMMTEEEVNLAALNSGWRVDELHRRDAMCFYRLAKP